MQTIFNSKVKETLYVEKLKNGLTVMIIPKKGIQKKYIIWGTHYGIVAAVAAIAYGVYRFFTPDYLEDFEDDFDDDFDDDFFEDESDEKEKKD